MKSRTLKTIFSGLLVMFIAIPPLFSDLAPADPQQGLVPGANQPVIDPAKAGNNNVPQPNNPAAANPNNFMNPPALVPADPPPVLMPDPASVKLAELTASEQKWTQYLSQVEMSLNMVKMMKQNLQVKHSNAVDVHNALSDVLTAISNAPVPPIPGITLITQAVLNNWNARNADLATKIDAAYNDALLALDYAINALDFEKHVATVTRDQVKNAIQQVIVFKNTAVTVPADPPSDIPLDIRNKIQEAQVKISQFNSHFDSLKSLARDVIRRVNQVVSLFSFFGIALNAQQQAVVAAANLLRDIVLRS